MREAWALENSNVSDNLQKTKRKVQDCEVVETIEGHGAIPT